MTVKRRLVRGRRKPQPAKAVGRAVVEIERDREPDWLLGFGRLASVSGRLWTSKIAKCGLPTSGRIAQPRVRFAVDRAGDVVVGLRKIGRACCEHILIGLIGRGFRRGARP